MATINNDHNVYVVGAGFSAARGLPLIANFMFALRDAHEWLIQQSREGEAESVQRVLEFRLHSTPTVYRVQVDLENIEELFSLAAAADSSLTRDICVAIAATLDYCSGTRSPPKTRFSLKPGGPPIPAPLTTNELPPIGLSELTQYEVSTYDFMLATLLGRLNLKKAQTTNAIISFNYDLLVEEALTSLEVPFSYGFPSKAVSEHDSSKKIFLSKNPETQLLKLHGSTNWAFPGYQGGRMTIFGSYEEVRAAEYVPQLVPPTWRKNFDGALSHVWQEAMRQISQATRLIVIGFSMPAADQHFKYLVAAGLRANISLREIVFVNPSKEIVEQRAKELFGDLQRRPTVRIAPTWARDFTLQGAMESTSESIGRQIHPSIFNLHHL